MRGVLLFTLLAVMWLAALARPTTPSSAAQRQGSFNIRLLSDHALTEGDVGLLGPAALVGTRSSAHALWKENLGNDQFGVFYSPLPYGDTRLLPGNPIGYYDGIDPEGVGWADGRACFTWREPVPDEGFNLFAWCTDESVPTEISDNDLTNGSVYLRHTMGSENGHLHTAWVEAAPGYLQRELFSWDEVTGETRLISRYTPPHSYVITVAAALQGDITHLAWIEFDSAGIFMPYYWNSAANTVHSLGMPNQDYSTAIGLALDGSGAAHVLWSAHFPGLDGCTAHWDSNKQQSTLLSASAEGCLADGRQVDAGQDGSIHTVWHGAGGLNYWGTAAVTTTLVTNQIEPGYFDRFTQLAGNNGVAHLTWRTSTAPEGLRLYYWNSAEMSVHTLSQPPAGQGPAGEPAWLLDEAGVAHLAWSETSAGSQEVFYWNSAGQTAVAISDPAGSTTLRAGPELHLSDTGLTAAWLELASTNGVAKLYEWRNGHGWSEELDLGEAVIVGVYGLRFDGQGDLHLLWTYRPGSGQPDDLAYWSYADSRVELSQMAPTAGNVVAARLHLSAIGMVYIIWAEGTGTNEGSDYFSAWRPPFLPYSAYMPIIRTP